MGATGVLHLGQVEERLCVLLADRLGFRPGQVAPASRFLEDLGCDSLDFVEVMFAVEEAFGVTLPVDGPDPVYKAVFTRRPFRAADLAELVYLRQGTGPPAWRGRDGWQPPPPRSATDSTPFSQLSGVWAGLMPGERLYERLGQDGPVRQYRRRSDGMRCVLVPGAEVELGGDGPDAQSDETPGRRVEVDPFLIDAEPVSVTAFSRFLNSVREADPTVLADWCVLDPADDRNAQAVLVRERDGWRPAPGTDRLPVVLVSWYGAAAYSLWVNGQDWRGYRDEDDPLLPTEAQWEYAARGPARRRFPWGDEPATEDRACFGRHRVGDSYRADTLPMPGVHKTLGVSPFGLRHMAGTVWQWCRDWYDPGFYRTAVATSKNPENRTPTGVRSERGGSWVGPAGLCRSSFRRGRPPAVRGRCLGFRCVGRPEAVG